jgi:diguanylate cyclase (GGDEF)-like protein
LSDPAPPSKRIPILIVDDEPEVLQAYRSVLEDSEDGGDAELDALRASLFPGTSGSVGHGRGIAQEFQLETAASAEEAVEKVRLALGEGKTFLVIFLDMRMRPGHDGLWAAERIRELDALVEIIICTAYSDVNPLDISAKVNPPEKIFYIQKPFHLHEVRQMAHALGHKRLAEDRVAHLAYFDDLTGLPNRARMLSLIGDAAEQAASTGKRFALLYFDLDNFKRINDALGHDVGDRILQEIAQRLQDLSAVLKSELLTPGPSGLSLLLSRPGSDEFILLLPLEQSMEQAASRVEAVVARLLEDASRPILLDVCEVQVTLTAGVAFCPMDGSQPEELFSHAELAMRFAKRQGRGSMKLFSPSMNEDFLRRLTLEGLLRNATDRQELFLCYEPQVDIATGHCFGMEALLRWQCTEVGMVSPSEFIPLAEETGLIIPIGEWVLREACRQVVAWRQEGLILDRICVNISPLQLSQPGFADLVEQVIEDTGLPPGCLELELTESSLLENPQAFENLLHRLKGRGVRFAIDDFGTGYSSLHRLKDFDIDRLKIDRSFIQNIVSRESDRGIISAILSMGSSLGLEVIAEGIEHPQQAQILRDLGCGQIQGYLISKALPPDQASSFLGQETRRWPWAGEAVPQDAGMTMNR